MKSMILTRLTNADGEVVGYFSDPVVAWVARREWNDYHAYQEGREGIGCHSDEIGGRDGDLEEDVEPSDVDRVEYWHWGPRRMEQYDFIIARVLHWMRYGAASVEVFRHLVNRYRRPGKSNRDVDLGGPAAAAGVLYVLRVKAPK